MKQVKSIEDIIYTEEKDKWLKTSCTAIPSFDLERNDICCLQPQEFCTKWLDNQAWYNNNGQAMLITFAKDGSIKSVEKAKK